MKQLFIKLLIISSITFVFQACEEDEERILNPEISSFNPTEGPVGTSVTVAGKDFPNTDEGVTVMFNGSEANITSVSNSQIVAVVPDYATTGPIKITINEKTIRSNNNFTVITKPQVTTASVTNITDKSATVGGNISSEHHISACGIVWNTTGNPTIADNKLEVEDEGGEFSVELSNLMASTTYNVKAFATNAAGTAYGTEVTFQTLSGNVSDNYIVSTFAGSTKGYTDGSLLNAKFNYPYGICINKQGIIYISECHRIRKMSQGEVTTLAGSNTFGDENGKNDKAEFYYPFGIDFDYDGNIYVADYSNHRIRKVTPGGQVSTFAGSTKGYADKTGTMAMFNFPTDVSVDKQGNVFVADYANDAIRKIKPEGKVYSEAGTTTGYKDGAYNVAQFNLPKGIAIDEKGFIYVADYGNNCIRKITPEGMISTLAGTTEAGYADGTGANAKFNYPVGIAVDHLGYVYVTEEFNDAVRRISPDGNVITIAGGNGRGFANGSGSEAKFNAPAGIAVDGQGNVYVIDVANHLVRKLTPQ